MRRVDKPWGWELIFAEHERYAGKILHIAAGQRISRQYHRVKDETLYVRAGQLELEIGREGRVERKTLRAGDAFHCAPGTVHRIVATTDVEIFEVSTPELEDVVRIEDAYGRI